jgi:hypothetical protein
VNASLPQHLHPLFWDVDPSAVDPAQQRPLVLDRVLEYGTLENVRWAEQVYGLNGIRDYFLARGCRVLSRKTQAFWRTVLELPNQPCTSKSSTPPNNPLWPY